MIAYQPVAFRPGTSVAPRFTMAESRAHQLGAASSMSVWDWLLLLGGAIVGGAGINGLIGQMSSFNAIGLLLDLVLSAVGLTLFFQKGAKLAS